MVKHSTDPAKGRIAFAVGQFSRGQSKLHTKIFLSMKSG